MILVVDFRDVIFIKSYIKNLLCSVAYEPLLNYLKSAAVLSWEAVDREFPTVLDGL